MYRVHLIHAREPRRRAADRQALELRTCRFTFPACRLSTLFSISPIRQEDLLSTFAALRVLAALTIAPVIAWSLHSVFFGAQDFLLASAALPDLSAQLKEPDWRFLLTSVYGNLIVGFVLAGVAAKFAPTLNQTFIRLTIVGSIVIGALMTMTQDYGTLVDVTLALSLVAGTVGYGMRTRGFSDRVYAD